MQERPCNPSQECKIWPNCFMDTHHMYYPKSLYKTDAEKLFRNLAGNTMRICRALHDDLHANERPPEKPSREVIFNVIKEAQGGNGKLAGPG